MKCTPTIRNYNWWSNRSKNAKGNVNLLEEKGRKNDLDAGNPNSSTNKKKKIYIYIYIYNWLNYF